MKAKIYVTLKQSVLDPQGKTVQRALEQMNYKNVDSVRIGRFLEVELNCDDEAKAAALSAAAGIRLKIPLKDPLQFILRHAYAGICYLDQQVDAVVNDRKAYHGLNQIVFHNNAVKAKGNEHERSNIVE